MPIWANLAFLQAQRGYSMFKRKDQWFLGKGRQTEVRQSLKELGWVTLIACIVILICGMIMFSCSSKDSVWADEVIYTNEQIADAIYQAEGGSKTRHPYGILAKYKHTTPRQACLNTISHAKKDWNGKGDFLEFLQKRYAPLNAKNDPTGLNKNWLKNVQWWLKHG